MELLAERAIFGLEGEEALELDRLLLACPELDELDMDLAAAMLESLMPTFELESRDTDSADAAGVVATDSTASDSGPRSASTVGAAAESRIPRKMPRELRERLVTSGEAWVVAHARPRSGSVAMIGATKRPDAALRSIGSAGAMKFDGERARPTRAELSRVEQTRRAAAGAPVAAGAAAGGSFSSAAAGTGTAATGWAGRGFATVGWIAAAAAVLFAVASWWPTISSRQTPEAARAELIAKAGDLLRSEWSTPGHQFVADFLCGDMVWSAEQQRGFMTITGLQPNDPTVHQYQLWIFDAKRDEMHPVDGGVFDVPATGEEIDMVVIPFAPKLPVSEATLFAVTVEPPGGAVVSKRDIVLVATVGP